VLDSDDRSDVEARARALADAGDHAAMTTLALESYGPELLGYLVAVARNETDADEAFAMLGEDLWRGAPGFRWDASLRTWLYTLARNALHRLRRDPHHRAGRRIPLSQSPVSALAAQVRSATRPYLLTEQKERVARLTARLDPDDQTLMILRVNRRMSWDDIARIMADDGEAPDAKSAARLRKRFERAKARLRELLDQDG
jgi:RNA polymerase sigma-70 factor (ECF subfamily)